MNSPVPSITDDQLDDLQVRQRADRMLELVSHHDDYAIRLDSIRRRDIANLQRIVGDLLNIIETGLMNPCAMDRARKIGREL